MTETQFQIQEYTKTAAALAELREKYAGAKYDVTTTDGMKAAKGARGELRDLRTSLERTRVQIKAPALERCRLIDEEAKRITAALTALEDPIAEQIRHEETRRERERAEKIAAEERRVAEIRGRIDAIRRVPVELPNPATAEQCVRAGERIKDLHGDFEFDEFTVEAAEAKSAAISRLQDMLRDAEERARQQAELEALRKRDREREAEEAKRRESEDAERRRVDGIRRLIHDRFTTAPDRMAGAPSQKIEARIAELRQECAPLEYAEFLADAEAARKAALHDLTAMLGEVRKLEADRAELERLRQENAAREKAERDERARRADAEKLAKARTFPGVEAVLDTLMERWPMVDRDTAVAWIAEAADDLEACGEFLAIRQTRAKS